MGNVEDNVRKIYDALVFLTDDGTEKGFTAYTENLFTNYLEKQGMLLREFLEAIEHCFETVMICTDPENGKLSYFFSPEFFKIHQP